MEQIIQQGFDRNKIIIYIDHPYDFQAVGTRRILKVKEALQQTLDLELSRCDDRTIDQSRIGAVIKRYTARSTTANLTALLRTPFAPIWWAVGR